MPLKKYNTHADKICEGYTGSILKYLFVVTIIECILPEEYPSGLLELLSE